VEDPKTTVLRSAGMVLENLGQLREVLIETKELEPPKWHLHPHLVSVSVFEIVPCVARRSRGATSPNCICIKMSVENRGHKY
jgi:hypothetical protein